MLFCRGARLSAAALDPALKPSAGSLQVRVTANRLGYVTWTLRNNNALKRSRASCVSNGSEGKREGDFVTVDRDSPTSPRFISPDSGHFGRALNLSKSRQSVNGDTFCSSPSLSQANTRQSGHVGTFESVLFTGGGEVCAPRWLLTAMQTRAASTAAAAQKRAPDAEEPSAVDKGEEQSLKEPPLSSPKAPGDPEPEEGKLNKTQQLKKVFKEYGAVGVSFHVTISLMSLGMFYLLVSSGIDMAAVLCKVGFSEAVVQSKMAAGTSTFVLAYAVHKLFAPVRMSITLVSVPLIVRYFRKTGLFKPPTPAP